MQNLPRVALFQAYWLLHSGTAFSALMLAKAGYYVDVFLFKVDASITADTLDGHENICVHSFQPIVGVSDGGSLVCSRDLRPSIRVFAKRLRTYLVAKWRRVIGSFLNLFRFWLGSEKGLFPEEILERTFTIMGGNAYHALIGIEKGGLAWAGAVARIHRSPLIYFNLELYTRDHWFYSGYWNKRLKAAEEKYHKCCWATIVQNDERGRVLLDDNRIPTDMKMLYLPVSRCGGPITSKHRWLQERLGLDDSQIIILSHGMISEARYSLELARIARSFPQDWTLVLHGFGSDSEIQKIRQLEKRERVRLSLRLADRSEEHQVVSSAKVSLVFYQKRYFNDRLTGFSSEKLALSLQCGIPVIAFDYPSYSHIRDEGCGVLVNDLTEIPSAILQILTDYENYRLRAFATFEKFYQFEINFATVLRALNELRQ
jgi:glycosyltransferase involved in cell wall biosynthesis